MVEEPSDNRLNQISTCWSLVCRAHGEAHGEMETARHELLTRYGGAVHRYLHKVVQDAGAAEELFQEFALRLLRGDFHRAAPQYGRFRDYVKTAVLRMVSRYHSRRQKAGCSLEIDPADPALGPQEECEQEFVRSWRAELLARAWQALSRLEQES